MSKNHLPQQGDKVNDVRRDNPFRNGFVIRVLYDDGPDEVLVRFDNGVESYQFSAFEYSWTDRLGGVFMLT